MNDVKELVVFLKLLADETRLRIVHLLGKETVSVGDLSAVLEMNQSAVSKHLVKLRLMNVVNDVRDGSFVFYSLNDQNTSYLAIIRFLVKQFSDLEVLQKDWETLQSLHADE
jgi:ArsR family transcriptional regulator